MIKESIHYNFKNYVLWLRNNITFFLLLLFCLSTASVSAQQRSVQSVIDIASKVLGPTVLQSSPSSGIGNSEEILLSSDLLNSKRLKSSNAEAFYVVRPESGKGFVIISADIRMRTILGFSYMDSFDEKNMPSQIKAWLQQYTDEMLSMESICSVDQTETVEDMASQPEPQYSSLPIRTGGVAPLLGNIQWNQSAPYNNKCPIDTDGERSVTGCVATAMAQVMKYHNYPVRGTGSVSYTTSTNKLSVSVTFGETYDWANMLDSYSGSYNTTQANAVATLMYHCGASTQMDYTSSSSGTQQDKIRSALYNNFGYDSDMACIEKENYTEEEWNTLLLTELNAGRPVNYAGSQGLSGHSFVFDGYEMRDGVSVPYYHVNWGWAGVCDGYYLTSSLAPSRTGIGGGYGNYTQRQQMVIGIKPEDNAFSTPVMNGSFTSSQKVFHYGDSYSTTISMSAYNRACRSFSGTIKLVAIASNGAETLLYTHNQSSSVGTSSSCSVNTTITLPSTMNAGRYKLEWRCFYSGKSSYSRIGFPEDHSIIIYDESPQLSATVVGDASSIKPSEQYNITLNVKNLGSMVYEGKIIANIHQTSYDVTLESEDCVIEAGATENVVISGWLRTMVPGNATITFKNGLDNHAISNMSGETLSLNANAEVATADVSVSSMKAFDYSSYHKTITIYSYNFLNNSSVNFVGSSQIVLMDTQNNIIRHLGNLSTNDGDGLKQGSYYIFARDYSFEFPSDIPNGNYRFGTVATQTNSGIWTLAKQWYSSGIQYLDIEVKTSSVVIGDLTFVRDPYNSGVLVTGITLNKTSASLTTGNTVSLTATITPSNATNKNVTWSSSNTSVATVSSSGVVTAVGAGNATITCSAADGSGKSATCSITVTGSTDLSARSNVVTTNTAEATVSFSTTNTYEWEWDSSNSRMRSTNYNINSTTSQTAISISATKSTDLSFAYAVSSESGYDKLTITLDGTTIVNAISGTTSSTYSGTLTTGSHTLVLKYSKDNSSKSGDDRAYISNMQLKSSAVLVTGISLNSTSASLTVGSTKTLTATITPSNATNKNVTWSSSNTSVATVSSSGVVTAVGAGSATITCTAADGSGKSATCNITVSSAYIDGDANSDNEVDVSDIALTVEYILGHSPSNFNVIAADLDKDNMIDVADVAMMVNIIMYGRASTPLSASKTLAGKESTPYIYITYEDNTMALWLQNADSQVSAMQFDLALPLGVDLRDVLPSSFMTQHSVSSSLMDSGMTRVICISLNNSFMSPDEHGIMAVSLSERIDQLRDLYLKNIIISTPDGTKRHLNDVAVANTTDIKLLMGEQQSKDVYSLNGQKRQSVQKGLNIIKTYDGSYKKVIIKK